MGKKKKKNTSPPGSPSITRSKYKYVFHWSLGEKYTKQQLEYYFEPKGKNPPKNWPNGSVDKNDKKFSSKNTVYKGKKLDKVHFRVRGLAKDTKSVNYEWSKWTTGHLDIKPPDKPKIAAAFSTDVNNVTTFGWEVKKDEHKPVYFFKWVALLSKNGKRPALDEDWSKKAKSSSNYSDCQSDTTKKFAVQGGKTITENFTTGYTRWLKVKAVGAGGESAWAVASHVYNQPEIAKNITTSKPERKNGRITMNVTWSSSTDSAHKITQSEVQYYIGTYGQNGAPTGSNWATAIGGVVKDTTGKKNKQTASIKIDSDVETDQCLWIRILNKYTGFEVESTAKRVITEKLAMPTINEIEYDSETYRVAIKATNNSQAYGSYLVLRYFDHDSTPISGKDIGMLVSGQTTSIQCPDWTGHEPIGFGVYAVLGKNDGNDGIKETTCYYNLSTYKQGFIRSYDATVYNDGVYNGKQYYKPIYSSHATINSNEKPIPVNSATFTSSTNPMALGYYETRLFFASSDTTSQSGKTYYSTSGKGYYFSHSQPTNPAKQGAFEQYYDEYSEFVVYAFDSITKSDMTRDGGDTPQAPKNVVVEQVGTSGTVQITWDSSTWNAATGAEIAWADHDDALYSTNQPSTFTVSNIKQSKLNIADLELGKTWYFWVRLYNSTTEGSTIYSEYSDIVSSDLTSAPNIPNFYIDKSTVTNSEGDNGRFTCSWDYESPDGTDQKSAQIYEVTNLDNDPPTYTPLKVGVVGENQTSIVFDVPSLMTAESTWALGSTHYLAVEVKSEANRTSGYSGYQPISIADPIELTVSSPSFIDSINPETYPSSGTATTISEEIDNWKDVHNAVVTIPSRTGTPYYSIVMTQSTTDDSEIMSAIFGTGDSNPEVEFYGGTYDILTGTLTSHYDSSGNVLANDVVYNLAGQDMTVLPTDGNNTFTTKAFIFDEVANPQTADLGSYYELDANDMYSKTFDTEIDPEKTYFEFVDSGASVGQTITVADNLYGTKALPKFPIDVQVQATSGAPDTISVAIYRYGNYAAPTPDENMFTGYDGETAFIGTYGIDDTISIISPTEATGEENEQALSQKLDDGGYYILRVAASDKFGQITEPFDIPFIVSWEHQAIAPDANISPMSYVDNNGRTQTVMAIKPLQPTLEPGETHDFSTDHIDIYRLSGDAPKLIYSGATFYDSNNPKATTYIDPYPTIGERGGYRIVLVTENGDYIQPDSIPAWTDFDGSISSKFQFIDFGGEHLDFIYNVDLDNSWNKSFTLTHYLGGSIQGDWMAGVERTSTVKGNTFDDIEPETYDTIRDLAEYTGVCHVRTIEGSNYTANVTVTDNTKYNSLEHQHDISLSVSRCDTAEIDGMTQANWEALQD